MGMQGREGLVQAEEAADLLGEKCWEMPAGPGVAEGAGLGDLRLGVDSAGLKGEGI